MNLAYWEAYCRRMMTFFAGLWLILSTVREVGR